MKNKRHLNAKSAKKPLDKKILCWHTKRQYMKNKAKHLTVKSALTVFPQKVMLISI
jgi:hypothetical protein